MTRAGGTTTGSGSSSNGQAASGGVGTQALTTSVAAFWIGKDIYAIDVAMVGEVVTVETVAEVPMARPGILGVFNLRGDPVALVDLSTALALPAPPRTRRDNETALVLLRDAGTLCAFVIDRMDSVLPAGRGRFTPRDVTEETTVVHGFLEVDRTPKLVVTVLDPGVVKSQLARLRY